MKRNRREVRGREEGGKKMIEGGHFGGGEGGKIVGLGWVKKSL